MALVEPSERALLRDAFVELNRRFYPGHRLELNPGGVSLWFSQDQIHAATHVHKGPHFLPWHRELVNRFEDLLRQVDSRLSLHYWDWTQDPRSIPEANLGGGRTGTLNLFTPDFMGYGGSSQAAIGEPWLSAGFYVPDASNHRDATSNPADPPQEVRRNVAGRHANHGHDETILSQGDYAAMRKKLEEVHDGMHGFVNMGGVHIAFRDPFVFLLHSNVDRLFAAWQRERGHPERRVPATVYGSESDGDFPGDGSVPQNMNDVIEPWAGGTQTRPWASPEDQQLVKTYKHPSVVSSRRYADLAPVWKVSWSAISRWSELNESVVEAKDLAFGDFNGNGKTDVFQPDGEVWWISWDGTSKWRQLNRSSVKLDELALGDFNGNGRSDVFHADGEVWWVSRDGTSGWQQLNRSRFKLDELAFGDFNGDGKTDVFRADGSSWWISRGGASRWEHLNTSSVRLNELAFGDFNGDGKTDLFHADGGAWLVSWGGASRWDAVNQSSVKVDGLRFGDFNGDGKTDVLRAVAGIWKVSWGARSRWRQINQSMVDVQRLGFGDFNGDGTTDVFVAGRRI